MEPYVGQIIAVGFNYAPANWALCDGSVLNISSNQLLYAVIGTTYGGDGVATFALPDLRGRVPIGAGTGTGQPPYALGQTGGTETVSLSQATMPAHTHALMASSKDGTVSTPAASTAIGINNTQTTINVFGTAGTPTGLSQASISSAPGSGQPHENRQPFTTINYIIATNGIFPVAN